MMLKTQPMALDKRDDPPHNDLLDTMHRPVKIEVHTLNVSYGKVQVL